MLGIFCIMKMDEILICDPETVARSACSSSRIGVMIPHQSDHLLTSQSSQSSPYYNQRSPLEYTFFRPFPRLVLSCINANFCVQGRIFQRFSSSTFFPLHHSRFLCFFRTFAPFFTGFDAIFAEL